MRQKDSAEWRGAIYINIGYYSLYTWYYASLKRHKTKTHDVYWVTAISIGLYSTQRKITAEKLNWEKM